MPEIPEADFVNGVVAIVEDVQMMAVDTRNTTGSLITATCTISGAAIGAALGGRSGMIVGSLLGQMGASYLNGARSVAEILRSTFTNTNLRDLFIESVINLLGPALDWAEMRLRMQISQYRILILGLVRRFLREHLHYESYEARLQP